MKNKLSSRPQNTNPVHLQDGLSLAVQNRIAKYNANPKNCSNTDCNTVLAYEKRHLTYCSRSCAATVNNKSRDPNIKTGPQKTIFPYSRVTFRTCTVCSKPFRFKKGNHKFQCSDDCFYSLRISDKDLYRKDCNFKLNKNDHPVLFDSDLISEYGWYSPSNKKNNLTGVSWDHLFRVSDGWKLRVNPEIMKHPANAELIPHTANQSRISSQITYEELLERISMWEAGNRNLTNFYKKNGK